MQTIDQAGTFPLGRRTVKRLGYGAMQLAGRVFGPPRDRVRRLPFARGGRAGVDHIDTSTTWAPRHQPAHSRGLAPYP